MSGRETAYVRVYPEDRDKLKAITEKRVKAWENKKNGIKPWIADLIHELLKKHGGIK